MSFSTLPAGHFHGGAHISAEGGDGKDLVTLLNLLNTDMLAAARAMDQKDSVKAATTANITLSGAQTIDGVSVIAGDRVLVKNQGTGSQNGIYVAAASTWARAVDMAAGADAAGALTQVEQGTAGANKWFACTDNKGSAVVGTDALTFADVSYAMSHEFMVGLLGGGASEHYHIGPAQRGFFVAKAASVGNLALTGAQTIDDIACAAGSVVLCKAQTDPKENGVYVVASGAWARSSGLATGAGASGCLVHVDQGTANANTNWQCTDAIGADVVGTNDLTFVDASTLGAHAAATAVAGHTGGAGTHTHATAGAQGGQLGLAAAVVHGAANEVAKTNAGATASEWGKITSANLANPYSRASAVVSVKDVAAGGATITKIVEFPYDVTITTAGSVDQIGASCSAKGAGANTVDIQIPVTGSILTAPIALSAAAVVDGAVTGGTVTIPAGTPISVIAACDNSFADVAVTISGRTAANLATADGRVPLTANPKDGAPTVLLEVPYALTVDQVNISCSGLGGGAPTVDVLDDGASILPGGAPVALVAATVTPIALVTPAVLAAGSVISVVIAAGGGAAADPAIVICGKAALV